MHEVLSRRERLFCQTICMKATSFKLKCCFQMKGYKENKVFTHSMLTQTTLKKKNLWPLSMDGVQLPQG